MKRISVWFILIVFSAIGNGQTPLKLIYNEYVDSPALTLKSTKGEEKGKINIWFKYQVTKDKIEQVDIKFEPSKLKEGEKIILIDRPGKAYEVQNYFLENRNKTRDQKDFTLSKEIFEADCKRFFKVTNNESYLVIKDRFETGVALIKDNDKFTFNVNNLPFSQNIRQINLSFYLYHGTEKSDIDSELEEIKINITIPNINDLCRKYDGEEQKYKDGIKDYVTLESSKAYTITKSKTEIENLIKEIEISQKLLERYKEFKDEIDKDLLNVFCPEFANISNTMEKFLEKNDPKNYQELKDQLKNRIKEIDAEKISQEKDLTQKGTEQVKDIPKQDDKTKKKEEPQVVKQTKKEEKPEIPCEDLIKKALNDLDKLNQNFTRESLITKISRIFDEIEALKSRTSKAIDSEKIKNELSEGITNIGQGNKGIEKSLDKFEKDLNWILSDLKYRKDCKDNTLADKVAEFKKSLNNYRDQCNSINKEIDEISNLISAGNRGLKDKLKAFYSPLFNEVLSDFMNIDSELLSFRNNFKSEKNSGKYYHKVKNRLLEQLAVYNTKYNRVSTKFDSLVVVADSAFLEKLNLTAIWSDSTRDTLNKIEQTKSNISNQLTKLQEEVSDSVPDKFPWLLIVLGALGAIILLFGAKVYYKAFKKRKEKLTVNIGRYTKSSELKHAGSSDHVNDNISSNRSESKPESQKVGGITITRITPENNGSQPKEAGKGLDHVIDQIGIEYKEIDLREYWQDTLVGKVYIHRSAIKKTYRFFLESCSNPDKVLETGGYLIGGWEIDKEDPNKYNVSFEDFIEPGDDAIYGEYQLNFGAKIGVRLENVIQNYREKMGKEFTLTAWFHSHPAIKIFLSNHDLDVQERLSSQEHKYKLLALVIDPITQDDIISFSTGIFSYKSNGTMNNNAGNLKMINWKHLYEWAISPLPSSMKDYYNIEMTSVCSTSQVNKLLLNDRCITRFSLFLDELTDKPDAHGVFKGEIINKDSENNGWVLLKDFTNGDVEIDEKEVIGRFYFTSNPENKIAELMEQGVILNQTEVIVLCDNYNKDLLILTRKKDHSFNLIRDIKKSISFTEIESWPTRRR